ncbi:copper-translocating P-type ATPase [Clostridium sp. CAG:356]|jgi:copper chaperone copZ|nr:copper-translocating P-type ATPase [Clostridium sp. CAG:356]
MKEIKLKIEGMHCTGCSSRLEKVLNNTDGVESATVSFEKKQAIITYNESQTDIEQIKQIIQDTGFKGE